MESMEEWLDALKEKYSNLKKVCDGNFKGLWPCIKFQLSIKSILNIRDCTLPFIGIILGRPGSQKTLGIELMRNLIFTYYTDAFSAKSFVSHSTSVKKEQLQEIDMLPKIKNKMFMTPELAPTFAKKEEDLKDIIGIITRIADGHGYKSDSGAHGGRGYTGEYMFVWIGAAVEILHHVHKELSNLGPKIYFYRVEKIKKDKSQYIDQLKGDEFSLKFKRVKDGLTDYLRIFDTCPELEFDKNRNLLKMEWDKTKDEYKAFETIVELGILLGYLRTYAKTWYTEKTQGTDYGYSITAVEEPDRAIEQLRNLARGHGLSQGRNYVTLEDIPILIKTVLSTASIERTTIFDLLLANDGVLKTSEIRLSLNLHEHVAHRTMAELAAVGLVDLDEGEHSNSEKKITLKSTFNWFLSEEFKNLRQGFKPTDYSVYLDRDKHNQKDKEKVASRKITPDYHIVISDYTQREGVRGENSASKIAKYECPRCPFKDPNPSKITEHRIKEHEQDRDLEV